MGPLAFNGSFAGMAHKGVGIEKIQPLVGPSVGGHGHIRQQVTFGEVLI